MPQTEQSFTASVTQVASLSYWLYLPQEYETQNAWPLIIFLHGYGERGDEMYLIRYGKV